jgi:hypothetical protein
MNKIDIFKAAAGFVAGTGAATVVTNAIKHTSPLNPNLVNKILIGGGTFALSGVAAAVGKAYTIKTIEEIIEGWNKVEVADVSSLPDDAPTETVEDEK